MYYYNDTIEILEGSGVPNPGEIQYDPETGSPVVSNEIDKAPYIKISPCRIETESARTASGTYIRSYSVFLPKSIDPNHLPGRGAHVRLSKEDGTIKNVIGTVANSLSTMFDYLIEVE